MAAESDAGTSFEDAVAVRAIGHGRYVAAVDAAWDGPVSANGGVLTAIMVRAAQAELGSPAPPPRTVSVHFLEAPDYGPVELEVEILRRGKRVAVCEVRMRDPGRLIAQMTLICSAARSQERDLARQPPHAPDQRSLEPVAPPPGAPPLLRRVEIRPTFGSTLFSGAREAVSGGWLALRDDDAALDAARLCALCDLWLPAIFVWLTSPAAAPTLQLTIHLRNTDRAVRGPVLGRFETGTLDEGHFEERAELWSTDGELLAESLQLALLVAPAPAPAPAPAIPPSAS